MTLSMTRRTMRTLRANHFDKMRRNMKHLDQIEAAARRIDNAMNNAAMPDAQFDAVLRDSVSKILTRVERIKTDTVEQ